ncbi:MAG: sigma-70 family RNA polymerase sigma factor [Oscillospiraceae bacterium]|nr:sigma-70 family RNA polymerase sigma factor [Oscillospiraceae bacterium]
MEDSEIIKLFEIRSEEALSETEKKYGAYCFSCAKNILENEEDAKETLSDTYLCLWNNIPPQKPENFRAFAAKICRNLALNLLRKRNAEKRGGGETEVVFEEISEFVSGNETPEHSFEQRELTKAIDGFLEKLSKEKREFFILRYWYFESVEKIARRTGKTENSVRNSLFRTRKKLREYLIERGFEI